VRVSSAGAFHANHNDKTGLIVDPPENGSWAKCSLGKVFFRNADDLPVIGNVVIKTKDRVSTRERTMISVELPLEAERISPP